MTNGYLVWLGIAGFAVNISILLVAITRGLSRTEAAIAQEILKQRNEIDDQINRMRHEIGETIAAVRAKMTESEIWNRDNFARRESVHTAVGRIEQRIEAMNERMVEQIDKLSDKIAAGFKRSS